MNTSISSRKPQVVAVKGNIVTVRLGPEPVRKNETAAILTGSRRLLAEVLRIRGAEADLQVLEDTTGIRVGDPVELSGELLSVSLGPGLLGRIFDGLQSPLAVLAAQHGFFLPRGVQVPALDPEHKWSFVPAVRAGDRLRPGEALGTVQEGRLRHTILVPVDVAQEVQVTWIQGGSFTVLDPVARIRTGRGEEMVRLSRRWPVRRSLTEPLLRSGRAERLFPEEPLTTTIRLVDTFFPIARGGTACIPGPFGAGKTVLQGLFARYAFADIVIVIACGERAGEVVEMIEDFGRMEDPQGGGSLMDRSIIICNTSSMPVAAREASIYTGLAIGEYYRLMGHQVLVLADSTSRWAQALRETSGNLEEIPGEEAYPAYLDAAIKEVYERAGQIRTAGGATGSLTLIGTVSPAGGNFEEPVTQSTLGTVKAFLGLSAERAYRRFYPAVDPLASWSRYRQQLAAHFDQALAPGWSDRVQRILSLLHAGDAVRRMMQVTGEEGVSPADFVLYHKALFVDMAYLQQDAFDAVDVSTAPARQKESFLFVCDLVERDYVFPGREEARAFFLRLTGLYRNLNYAAQGSPDAERLKREIEALVAAVG
ncbi:MAG: V-type ATP synthase subunit A [Thermodesulfobacteriota bacterium]